MNNTKINAVVVADSINSWGNRITSLLVTMPRIILAEFNTHRMFSRNTSSSRAIPFNKMVESVEKDPFIPIAWQKDHKGMQGSEYITDEIKIEELNSIWLYGRDRAIEIAKTLHSDRGNDIPVTKQLCNRLLEPFMWTTVLVTSTEWENFFSLRCPQYTLPDSTWNNISDHTIFRSRKDLKVNCYESNFDDFTELDWLQCNKSQAEIHMMALAEAMWDALNESTPKELKAGEFHLPFIEIEEDL